MTGRQLYIVVVVPSRGARRYYGQPRTGTPFTDRHAAERFAAGLSPVSFPYVNAIVATLEPGPQANLALARNPGP